MLQIVMLHIVCALLLNIELEYIRLDCGDGCIILNLLKSIDLYIHKWVILWYVSYTSVKLIKSSRDGSDAQDTLLMYNTWLL